MSIRELIENGIQIQGPLKIVRYSMENETDDVVYYSKDPEHILLREEYEYFINDDILYMYTIDDGNPMLVIEVA